MAGLVKKAKGLQRFMLDCGFWRSRKWKGQNLAAIGLQSCAISYCYEHGTDGVLPGPDAEELALSLGLRARDVAKPLKALTDAGIWKLRDDEDYEIVGYLEHNPSSDDVKKYRDKRALAGAKGNHDRWHAETPDPDCMFCQQPPPSGKAESDSDRKCDRTSDRNGDRTTESQSRGSKQAEQASRASIPPYPPEPHATALAVVGPADEGGMTPEESWEAGRGYPERRKLAGQITNRVMRERKPKPTNGRRVFELVHERLGCGWEPEPLERACIDARALTEGALEYAYNAVTNPPVGRQPADPLAGLRQLERELGA